MILRGPGGAEPLMRSIISCTATCALRSKLYRSANHASAMRLSAAHGLRYRRGRIDFQLIMSCLGHHAIWRDQNERGLRILSCLEAQPARACRGRSCSQMSRTLLSPMIQILGCSITRVRKDSWFTKRLSNSSRVKIVGLTGRPSFVLASSSTENNSP